MRIKREGNIGVKKGDMKIKREEDMRIKREEDMRIKREILG